MHLMRHETAVLTSFVRPPSNAVAFTGGGTVGGWRHSPAARSSVCRKVTQRKRPSFRRRRPVSREFLLYWFDSCNGLDRHYVQFALWGPWYLYFMIFAELHTTASHRTGFNSWLLLVDAVVWDIIWLHLESWISELQFICCASIEYVKGVRLV